jgi:nucleoside-diphosphate-sugar epimerase
MEKVTIISLGWLGLALYQRLETLGYEASGSYNTFTKNVKNEFKFDINKDTQNKYIIESDVIIINLPPSKIENNENFLNIIREYANKKIVFISSTSVYGMQGDVDENTLPTPETSNGSRLLAWEKFIQEHVSNFQIIRSAGQFGAGRHPANFLSGKENISGGNKCVNMISQEDLLEIITKSLKSERSQVINATNTSHPTKKEYYTQCCKAMGLPVPSFVDDETNDYKKINTIYKEYDINSTLTLAL